MKNSRPHVVILVIAGITLTRSGAIAAQACPSDTTTRQELREAMREATLAPGGTYSLLATTNSMRFQSAVFQTLIERALVARPGGGTLFIPHDDLWWEFLTAAGLGAGEADQAPVGRRLAFEYHQSIELFYGPPNSIVREIEDGPEPLLAANVRLTWPDRPDRVRQFSFEDTSSVPRLKSTNHQLMTFRFLVFPDMIVFDDIKGISGRPLSGVLGTIFKVIGEGNAVFTRFSISTDGQQVLRAKITKLVSKTVTATIQRDGSSENGVPEHRPDLIAIETRLKQPLEIEYFPYRCWSSPG